MLEKKVLVFNFLHIMRDRIVLNINSVIENYAKRKDYLYNRGIISYFFNSRGYVIIIVMIITTLLMSLSANFMTMAMTNRFYMEKMSDRFRASLIAQSGIAVGRYLLDQEMRNRIPSQYVIMLTGKKPIKDVDSYNDIWAVDFPEFPIPLLSDENLTESEKASIDEQKDIKYLSTESLYINIEDENSKINLSALSNEKLSASDQPSPFYSVTYRFFLNMEMPEFSDIILDWVDTNDNKYPYGAETYDYYQNLPVPYSAKNDGLDCIDELLMLKDMTPEIYYGMGGGNYEQEIEDDKRENKMVDDNKGNTYLSREEYDALVAGEYEPEETAQSFADQEIKIGKEKSRRLSDYFTVYGYRNIYYDKRNKINVNTASYRVLSALTDNMDDTIVTNLIKKRLQEPFKTVEATEEYITDKTVRDNLISVQSFIFKIVATGTYNDTQVTITVFYDRYTKKVLYWSEQ